MSNEAITWTDEQLEFIEHPMNEHGRLLAGPGTGKSLTAVALVEHLLTSEPKPKIKFITFTRAATAELADKLSDSRANAVAPSTFHSFAISALIRNPGSAAFPSPLRIPSNFEYRNLIRPHLARLTGVSVRKFDDLIAEMAAKWESLVPEENPDVTDEERAAFMGTWSRHREIFGYTLLDELPDLFRCALRDHKDLSGLDYELLIVDEYQDLNACELEVLQRLSSRGVAILAVGDDDQSIYSFRKAHPAGIRRFLEDFETECDYELFICHRSPQEIVDWSQFVIQGDTSRPQRHPPRVAEDNPVGQVALLNFRGFRREAEGIAKLVEWMIKEKEIPASEILILYRADNNGVFTRPIREELAKKGIAVQDADAVKQTLRDTENQELLAVLRLLVNPTDSLAWWTLVELKSGLGDTFVTYLYELAVTSQTRFGATMVQEAMNNFEDAPSGTRGTAVELWNEITARLDRVTVPTDINDMNWGTWVTEGVEADLLPNCTVDLQELLLAVGESLASEQESFERFLSLLSPIGQDLARARSEGVRFMSMASAKGLTVRATIIAGVDHDLLPHPRAHPDEERRLLYVAMTRAKEILVLTWANRRQGPGARSGRANLGRRQHTIFLRGGPVESQDGEEYISNLFEDG